MYTDGTSPASLLSVIMPVTIFQGRWRYASWSMCVWECIIPKYEKPDLLSWILSFLFIHFFFLFGRRKTSTIETICDRSVCHMHLATASTNRRTEKWRWQLWTEKKDFKVARFSGFFIYFFLIFKFSCPPSLPRVSGSRKDVKHGSKVKGNTKTELTRD